jgi:UDP:flavonoid glycosyltransferase YjiC (YdhE family)
MRPLAMAMGAFPLNAVRVRYGLPPISHDLREAMSYADYAVYPDIPELVPTRALPREHRYLGPLLWSVDTALPEWWNRVPEDKPVVYLNLGSSGAHDQLEMALKGLAQLPVTVIAATASNGSVAKLPDNAFLATYLPAEAATQRASLTINNGGAMSTQQSFHAGVPVLGLVTHADQLVFSKAVRQAGAGEFLTPSEATAPAVSALVKRMLETPSYGERERWLRDRMEAYDPAARFLQLMREIAGRQAPRQ